LPPPKKKKKKKRKKRRELTPTHQNVKKKRWNFFFKSKEVGILKNRWVMKCQIIKAKISVY